MTKRGIWLLFIIMLMAVTVPGIAQETAYSCNGDGVRLYAATSWQVLTQANLSSHEDALQALGTSGQVVAANFSAKGVAFQVTSPEGYQAELYIAPGLTDFANANVWQVNQSQKDLLLSHAAKLYPNGQVAWSSEYPSFMELNQDQTLQGITIHTKAYITLYYGNLYVLESQCYGQALSPAQSTFLDEVLQGVLFLGDCKADVPAPIVDTPVLPAAIPYDAGIAEVTISGDDTPLTIIDPPARSDGSELTIAGTTTPNTSMRYYLNGDGQSRFTSDDDGNYTFTIKKLSEKGKNNIMVQAIGDNGYGTASFKTVLELLPTPLAVTPQELTLSQSTFDIQGIVLPGSTVYFVTSRGRKPLDVDENGRFTTTVTMKDPGDYTYTIQANEPNYAKTEATVTLHRIPNQDDDIKVLAKKAKTIGYQKLLKSPDNYENRVISLTGTIQSIANDSGILSAVFETDKGDIYLLQPDSLIDLIQGGTGEMLCTLTGQTAPTSGMQAPCATINHFIPNN